MITLEEFKKKHSDKCRLIGLDLGSKRIGVSICDEKQLIATPLKTINRNTLNELISDLSMNALVTSVEDNFLLLIFLTNSVKDCFVISDITLSPLVQQNNLHFLEENF